MPKFWILAAVAMQAAAQEAIRVAVHLVNVTFSVRDSRGTPVGDLTRDDFEILEDNVPQKVAFFGRQNDLPISLGLLIDASGSQEHFGKQHHHDLHEFLTNTLQPGDRAL